MATVTTCDGTGVEIPPDTPTTGIFGHQYCDAARPIAETYLEEVETLHKRLAIQFQAELEELRARYRGQLKQLPDEP